MKVKRKKSRGFGRTFTVAGSSALLGACCPCQVAPEDVPSNWDARFWDNKASPGRIAPDQLPATLERFNATCRAGSACSPKPLAVGHVAGSLHRYPMEVHRRGALAKGWAKHPTCAENVNDLMDRAFSDFKLDGIEIDAHAIPSSNPEDCKTADRTCAFVVHDDPPWDVQSGGDSPGKTFLQENSLVRVLTHFATQHAANGRRLYLELKEPKGCKNKDLGIGGKCAMRMTTIVKQVIAVDMEHHLADQLDFISFSRHALSSAHAASVGTALDGHVGYQFIAGVTLDQDANESDRRASECALVAFLSQPVDRIRSADLDWLAEQGWLSGVWFSPRCYNDAAESLSAVNAQRTSEGRPALKVGVSTYQQEEQTAHDWLRQHYASEKPGLPVVDSFIFDIEG